MKLFIKRFLAFVLPIILTFIIIEILIRNIPNDYSYKKQYLDKNSNNIEKLFLGSSHTYYGINPEYITGKGFNLSHISQTINYDYELIKKYDNKWDNLECIAIPIDYFTLFSKAKGSVESWRIKNYNIYYKLGLSNKLSENSEFLTIKFKYNLKRLSSYYVKKNSCITCSELGYGNVHREKKNLNETGIEAAKRHTEKDHSHFDENVKTLNSIIKYAKAKNIKILLYTSPAYITYINNLDKEQLNLTIETSIKMDNNYSNCTYINLLDDRSFSADDFRDADHLNSRGAQKLTVKIDSVINKILLKNTL